MDDDNLPWPVREARFWSDLAVVELDPPVVTWQGMGGKTLPVLFGPDGEPLPMLMHSFGFQAHMVEVQPHVAEPREDSEDEDD